MTGQTLRAAGATAAWPLVLMLVAAIFLNYVDRGMLAVAGPLIQADMGLSATEFGLALSAFFWTYAPMQLVIGWMADHWRVERLMAGGVALWGLATAATAAVTGFAPLLALRVLLGIGESVAFPASSKLLARHIAPGQRGIANAGIAAALAIGPAFGTLAGGAVMIALGWHAMFLIFGLATLLWLLPWRAVSARIAAAAPSAAVEPVPMRAILRRRELWVQSLAHFTTNYGFYFLLSWLPLYLTRTRGLSLETMTAAATATFAIQGVSALAVGWLSDRLVRSGRNEGRVRQYVQAASHVVTAVGILGVVGAEGTAHTVGWLLLTGIGIGGIGVGVFSIGQIFAGPRAAGRWIGVQNFVGNLSGVLGPIVTGMIVDSTGRYDAAFHLAAGITALGALLWTVGLPRLAPIDWDARR